MDSGALVTFMTALPRAGYSNVISTEADSETGGFSVVGRRSRWWLRRTARSESSTSAARRSSLVARSTPSAKTATRARRTCARSASAHQRYRYLVAVSTVSATQRAARQASARSASPRVAPKTSNVKTPIPVRKTYAPSVCARFCPCSVAVPRRMRDGWRGGGGNSSAGASNTNTGGNGSGAGGKTATATPRAEAHPAARCRRLVPPWAATLASSQRAGRRRRNQRGGRRQQGRRPARRR